MARGSSLTQDAYRRLRSDLLACRLRPGDKLKVDDLCQRLAVGSSAVREALSRLSSEGFIVLEPQRGFFVAPLALDELRDLTNVRCQIEELCLRQAIRDGDIGWEAGLVASFHRLSHTPERAPGDPKRFSDEFGVAHTAFHEALVAACGSPWLHRIRKQLYVQQERYRWLSMPLARYERDLNREHREIMDAALARDADGAVERLATHLRATADILLDSQLQPRPDGSGEGRTARLAAAEPS